METVQLPAGIRDLPVVAGDLALDFANTVDDPLGPERHDHIATYHALLSWSVRRGLLPEAAADDLLRGIAPRQAAAAVRKAHSLREAINRTAGAVADAHATTGSARAATATATAGAATATTGSGSAAAGGPSGAGRGLISPPLEGWEELRPFVVAAVERMELVGLQPTWRFERRESPLWPVALAAYELLTGPRAGRIKRCAGCPWLFLDQSKNSSRRWCSMDDCGTSAKIRLYVSRRAARRSQS